MATSSEEFSEFVKRVRQEPWSLLPLELEKTKKNLLNNSDVKKQHEIAKRIQKIEDILLESSQGLIKLAKDLEAYPGIEIEIKRIENEKTADAKKPEASSWFSSASSYLYSGASTIYTTGQYLFKFKINTEFAARAKMITDKTIKDNLEEDKKGLHSNADRNTLTAIYKLSDVYKNVSTDGSVKKAIKETFIAYGFPTEVAALDRQLLIKFKEREMIFPQLNIQMKAS